MRMSEPREDAWELSSGQWCLLHECHQDDSSHAYSYPECEQHLRPATPEEEAAFRAVLQADMEREDR